MSDRHGEPVEVLRHFADPAHFIWHGRLYVVHDVVAHWAEVDQWWRAALTRVFEGAVAPTHGAGGSRETASHGPVQASAVKLAPTAGSDWVVTDQTEITILPHMRTATGRSDLRRARQPLRGRLSYTAAGSRGGRRTGAVIDDRHTTGDLDGQFEFWRVNAGLGRSDVTRVFDLCHDVGTGQWTLNHTDTVVPPGAASAHGNLS